MRIAVIGSGYVGLTTGTCFAELGNEVICVDIDEKKVENLNKGIIPIYEPGLEELFRRNTKENRLSFTSDFKKAVENSEIIFIAVGTPQKESGEANLEYVFSAAKEIAKYMNSYKIIVDKSTVPVGTSKKVREIIKNNLKTKIDFDVVSNPEFLREGSAIKDFMVPDRVVVGTDSEKAKEIMKNLYSSITRPDMPLIITTPESAEMIKYASNAMLATRISFMNELSHLCEKVGADIKEVANGMGFDKRIGPRFLQAGIGYGGSCFPKDVQALIYTLKQHGCSADILEAVEKVNKKQKTSIIPKIKSLLPALKDKKIAVWGLAFKPKTDDLREAPALEIIKELLNHGARITAFDPVAQENAKKMMQNITYAENPLEALKDADALIIATEWDEFRNIDKEQIKSLLKHPNIIDGRNIWDPKEMKKLGFNYIGVGR